MADENLPEVTRQIPYAHVHGNKASALVSWSVAAFANNRSIALLRLYKGMRITSVQMTVRDASNAGVTLDVGYEREGAADDADHFIDGASTAAQAHFDSRANTFHAPFMVDAEVAYLTATVRTALTAATIIDFEVEYIYEGNL